MTSIEIDYSLIVGFFAGLLFWVAWRERVNDNTRDARLLAVLGAGTGLAAIAVAIYF